MAIVLGIPNATNLVSWNGLRESIAAWLDRTDLADRIPDFIRLAEARFRREITRTEQEAVITLPSAVPVDLDSVTAIYLTDTPTVTLTQVSPAEIHGRYAAPGGRPIVYAIEAGQIITGPPATVGYSATMLYNRKIPALSSTMQSNWLLADHPDLYLFGSLLHAEFFGWNDDRLPTIKSAVDEMIAEINAAGNRRRYGGGPLVARPAVVEAARGAYRR